MTTNNWSLAIDLSSDSCVVGVPRSNAYETIDVRYCWWAAKRCICILLHGSIGRDTRVHISGANMLTHVVLSPQSTFHSHSVRSSNYFNLLLVCLPSRYVTRDRTEPSTHLFSFDTCKWSLRQPYHNYKQNGHDCLNGHTPDNNYYSMQFLLSSAPSQKCRGQLIDSTL